MTHRPRVLARFESATGDVVVTFPPAQYEWESSQPLRTALSEGVGTAYAHDQHGTLPGVKGVSEERVRGLLVRPGDGIALDDALQELRSRAWSIGRGRLVTVDAAGNERWAWARLAKMPEILISYSRRDHAPVVLSFVRLSDWHDAEAIEVVQNISTGNNLVTVVNPGTATVRDMVFTLRPLGTNGFTTPRVTNQITNEWWQSNRPGTVTTAHRLEVDTGANSVRYSTDGGGVWTSAYSTFATGPVQVGFIRLLPGTQQLAITNAVTAELRLRFFAAYD